MKKTILEIQLTKGKKAILEYPELNVEDLEKLVKRIKMLRTK